VGLGRHWKDACWSPTAWIYYDYASGDANPNDGDFNTFNQLHRPLTNGFDPATL